MEIVNITKIIEKNMRKNSIMQNIMLSYYQPIVQKEVGLCGAKSSDNILCVGGGHFPATAILFHLLTGAKVTVIDNDKKCIKSAKEVVELLGLTNKVIVKCSEGIEVSGGEFDIIHMAMQISPKEKVFKHIYSTMNNKSRLIVRTPKRHLERGYQPFKDICEQNGWVKQPSFSNIERSLLYVR